MTLFFISLSLVLGFGLCDLFELSLHSYEWELYLNVQSNKYEIFTNCGNRLKHSLEKVRPFGLSVAILGVQIPEV